MAELSRRALLRRIIPGGEPEPVPLYSIRVSQARCIVFRGPECGACAGLCPDGEQALALRRGRPVFVAESCSGCGHCVVACPTIPAALEIECHDRGTQAEKTA